MFFTLTYPSGHKRVVPRAGIIVYVACSLVLTTTIAVKEFSVWKFFSVLPSFNYHQSKGVYKKHKVTKGPRVRLGFYYFCSRTIIRVTFEEIPRSRKGLSLSFFGR